MKISPDDSFERVHWTRGHRAVAGVDEAGRGPLAGPVVAAAVILEAGHVPGGLNDSKALTAKRRSDLFDRLLAAAHVSVGIATVAEIDDINIYHASHMAMVRAVEGLRGAEIALIDGNAIPKAMAIPCEAVVKGDARCISIAAASIVAKVTRDRIMVDLAQQHPGYGWERNAGYATEEHRSALSRMGVTPHHRRSFAPVHNILCREKSSSL